VAGASAVAACATTTTTAVFTPITGIVIQSQSLLTGFICGDEDDQVYRYAAVVTYAGPDGGPVEPAVPVEQSGAPLTNIFECFTDGVFENLPSSDAGSLSFTVSIFAYNKKEYVSASLPSDLACPPMVDGGFCTAGSEPISSVQEAAATWTTVCTATQLSGTPVFAVCGPLLPLAPLVTGSDATADAAPEASTDAAADASGGQDGGSDAGGPADAGDGAAEAAASSVDN
jgi:hypothetical protein